jgi:hypothetical protein
MKTPINLTLTRFPNLFEQEAIVVHPSEVEEFGQQFVRGRKGSKLVAQVKGEVWEVIRGNNTEFFAAFDKVKKPFWWFASALDTTKWFTPENRVTTWEAAWK